VCGTRSDSDGSGDPKGGCENEGHEEQEGKEGEEDNGGYEQEEEQSGEDDEPADEETRMRVHRQNERRAQRVNMKYDNRQCQEDTATVFIKEPSCIFLQ